MGLLNNVVNFLNFKDTIFLKESSNLQNKYNALNQLIKEYPNNEEIKNELYTIKKGLDGENEIRYQLSKANIGLYVLHDINIEFEDLKAQIDYVVITKCYCYFIECKNLIGNITVDEKGDFIREYTFNDTKTKIGMYSPLTQVENQRAVYKKIWNNRLSSNPIINSIKRYFSEDSFNDVHRVLVVAANNETILNTKYAPKSIKYKIMKADSLVRQIQYDLDRSNKSDWINKNAMEKWANSFLNINVDKGIDYYTYYKNKFLSNICKISDDELRNVLVEFRKNRADEMNVPAYYVFTNEELEEIIKIKPKTVEELKQANILTLIKINTHGKQIVDELTKHLN